MGPTEAAGYGLSSCLLGTNGPAYAPDMTLGQTVPALPVASVRDAVPVYVDQFGFRCAHQNDEGFAIVVRDDAELHLWQAGDETWRGRSATGLLDGPVRSGAESFIAGTASCRIAVGSAPEIDALHAELAQARVLHPTDVGSPVATDHGTREFAALDHDGNLLTFFHRT